MSDAPVVVVVDDLPTTTTGVTSEDAVRMAEIEAARSVDVAAIHAATDRAAIDAGAAADDEDMQWLKAELTALQARCEMNAVSLSSAEAVLATLSNQVAEMAGALLILSQQSTPPLPSEPEPPATPEPEIILPVDAAGGPRTSHAAPAPTPERRHLRRL